eukprot:6183586-Pleurochrysis_carterae.AAC.6
MQPTTVATNRFKHCTHARSRFTCLHSTLEHARSSALLWPVVDGVLLRGKQRAGARPTCQAFVCQSDVNRSGVLDAARRWEVCFDLHSPPPLNPSRPASETSGGRGQTRHTRVCRELRGRGTNFVGRGHSRCQP